MNSIIPDLEHTKRKLAYFIQLQEKYGDSQPTTVAKWIEIYSERIQQAEQMSQNPGLKVQMSNKSVNESESLHHSLA